MKEYFYMKEIMEYFNISRDAIKYYEQKGLITSYRDKNGYRKFTTVMFKKIEWICTMRSIGVSLDEIKLSLSEGQMIKNGELAFAARIQEIEEQKKRLELAEKVLLSNREFVRSIPEYYLNCHLYPKFFICLASVDERACEQDALWRRGLHVFEIDSNGEIQSEYEYEKIVQDAVVVNYGICEECKRKGDSYVEGPAIRMVIKKSDADRIQDYIKEMHQWGMEYEISMKDRVYCTYAYYCETEEEGIALDLYLPVRQEDKGKGGE